MRMKVTQVELTYNPYTVKATLLIDGENVTNGIYDSCKNKRLQHWIDKFLCEIFQFKNVKNIDFTFTGTALDAEDVKDAVYGFNQSNSRSEIKAHYKLSDGVVEQKVTKLKELFAKSQDGPFEELRSKVLKKQFEAALSPEFEVNVIATMSSGKSTVINAMLGKELMPAKNEACTATIARIEDDDSMDDFQSRRVNERQDVIDDWRTCTADLLNKWNDDKETSTIYIKGNIPAIQERENIGMVLVDTPGPNNARDVNHRKATNKAIMDKPLSMVLYVLNATQLSTEDDQSLLRMIRESMEAGGREAQDRFIFIANKIDCFDPERGEDVGKALTNVRNYLIENGLKNPLVIPASAELTKLIRIARFEGEDSLTRRQRGDLNNFVELFVGFEDMNMLKHVKAHIAAATYNTLDAALKKSINHKDKHCQAEILSGIPIVEALLDNFISKHAIPAKLKDAVDTFESIMQKADCIEKLNLLIEKDNVDIQVLSGRIEEFSENKKRIQAGKKFRDKIKNEEFKLSKESKKKRMEVDKEIKELLDDLQLDFEEKVDPSKAQKIFSSAARKCEGRFDDIQSILEFALEEEFILKVESYRNQYEKQLQDIVDEAFPQTEDICIKEFQATAMQMPSVNNLIKENTVVIKHKEIVGTERYGFLWLKKRTIYETREEKLVDMSGAFEALEISVQQHKTTVYNEFDLLAKENIEKAKEILLKSMDQIDEKMNDLMNKIKSVAKDKESKNQMINENRKKIEWYNNFKSDLNAILSI